MSTRDPIDVTFKTVRPPRARAIDANAVEQILNTVFGSLFLAIACYGVHLFLVNNF